MRDPDKPSSARNVLGSELTGCCDSPATGFYRDGYCHTGPQDVGSHTVCVKVTREFLDFSVQRGNDLVTAHPEFDFPGLKPGDRWCICVARWREAFEAGAAPQVMLTATHEKALGVVTLDQLKRHAADLQ
jgi:uncharacterized protein (DUF2237 family)